jgi:hypothetical protein
MSTAVAPELSAANLWGFLWDLTFRLVADPQLFAKIRKLWTDLLDLVNPPPQAVNSTDLAIIEGWFAVRSPESIFGEGGVVQFIAGISAFLKSHPQLIAILMQVLALLPKKTA